MWLLIGFQVDFLFLTKINTSEQKGTEQYMVNAPMMYDVDLILKIGKTVVAADNWNLIICLLWQLLL